VCVLQVVAGTPVLGATAGREKREERGRETGIQFAARGGSGFRVRIQVLGLGLGLSLGFMRWRPRVETEHENKCDKIVRCRHIHDARA
jgi:hypothetical protein